MRGPRQLRPCCLGGRERSRGSEGGIGEDAPTQNGGPRQLREEETGKMGKMGKMGKLDQSAFFLSPFLSLSLSLYPFLSLFLSPFLSPLPFPSPSLSPFPSRKKAPSCFLSAG